MAARQVSTPHPALRLVGSLDLTAELAALSPMGLAALVALAEHPMLGIAALVVVLATVAAAEAALAGTVALVVLAVTTIAAIPLTVVLLAEAALAVVVEEVVVGQGYLIVRNTSRSITPTVAALAEELA